MKYSVFSSVLVVFLSAEIHVVTPNDLRFQEQMEETSQFHDIHSSEFQSISPRSKNVNTHFLFQIHDAINSLHDLYLTMLRSEILIKEQYGMKPNISHRCIKGLNELSLGVREKRLWALTMVDSCGNIPSGILEGNFYSTGDFDQCIDSKIPGKFQGQYCEVGVLQNIHFQYKSGDPLEPMDLSYLHETNQSKVWSYDDKFPNGLHPVTTSLCLPSTCSVEDMKYLISKVSNAFKDILKIEVLQCIVKSQHQYTNSEKLGMTMIIAIVLLEIIATLVDVRWNVSQGKNKIETNLLKKTLLCLSHRNHFAKFFKQNSQPESVKIFNGLKLFSSILIIFAHTILYYKLDFAQFKQFYKSMSSLPGTVFWNIPLTVETFYFMSGFLVLYTYIKSENSTLNLVHYVLRRYLKLWIPVLFIHGSCFFFMRMSHGPMWSSSVEKRVFGNTFNWWKNALCINNFSPQSEQFLHWTWHLAIDMQLYISAYFILLIYRKYPAKAINIIKIVIAVVLIFLAFRQYRHGFGPTRAASYSKPSGHAYAVENIHYTPYHHIAPFCVGMLTCHEISTNKDIQISKVVKILGWLISITLTYACWFLPHIWNAYRLPTTIESVLFGSLHRFLWSPVLAWITFLYFKGEGGILVSLLSWEGFTHLGNLSFMAFLIQSPFIRFQIGLSRNHYPFSFSSRIAHSLVTVTVTYLLAFIVHLVCEAPLNSLIGLLSVFLRGRTEAKKTQ